MSNQAMHPINRREALLALGAASLLAAGRALHAQATRTEPDAQHATIAKLSEIIIPATDTPGAIDAGVPEFIAIALSQWCMDRERDSVRAGLAALEAVALRPDSLAEAARALDDAAAKDERHWFGLFKFLTVWGYYTSRVAVTEELRFPLMPGYYDGDAPYTR